MKERITHSFTIAVLIAIILTGCGGREEDETPPAPTATATREATPEPLTLEPVAGEANVESIQIIILESFPVQVNVLARGQHPDGCTDIDEIRSERSGQEFTVSIATLRPADAACTEALVPFEETIPLDVLGLDAGRYTVTVNGIAGSFTLDIDNRIPDETPTPTAEPEPTEAPAALISGLVWHDLCAVVGAEGAEEVTPSEGCIATADGESFQANGLLEASEPGIEGVVVNLGLGECPASGLDSVTTDANGEYVFTGLDAGTYCVSVDALLESNTEILVPGGWTFPGVDLDNSTVTVAAGETTSRVNFGWDYQFLPVPEVDPATCTNSIAFVEDLSVPDDTAFTPGEAFVKSWRLRNTGSCPWTEGYSLEYIGGDTIPGPTTVPIPVPVVTGQTVDVSVSLTAPAALGTYRANYQLSNASGDPFGVNGLIDEAFWVQIVVSEAAATPVPSSAVIGGVIWADSCFLRSDGSPSIGCVETAEGSGFYVADGSLNNRESVMPGLNVTLSNDACPAEGAIPAANVIATAVTDEDGLYRFAELNGGTYCVSIDAFSAENVDILIPGDWTWPARGVGQITVFLDDGEQLLDVDFGWDHADD